MTDRTSSRCWKRSRRPTRRTGQEERTTESMGTSSTRQEPTQERCCEISGTIKSARLECSPLSLPILLTRQIFRPMINGALLERSEGPRADQGRKDKTLPPKCIAYRLIRSCQPCQPCASSDAYEGSDFTLMSEAALSRGSGYDIEFAPWGTPDVDGLLNRESKGRVLSRDSGDRAIEDSRG
jgi:hypothetical protein